MLRVVRGRRQERWEAAAFDELAGHYERLTVDVGTGDGRLPYRRALAEPTALHVGCDPVAANMAAISTRSLRKPARGGAPNVLLVVAAVEEPPDELAGRADEVTCVLPWGRLLEGLVTADADVLRGLRTFAKPGAPVRIVLNTGVWETDTPRDVAVLPAVTPERITGDLAPGYAAAGLRLVGHGDAPSAEVRALESTWAGRLTHGGAGRFVRIEAVAG